MNRDCGIGVSRDDVDTTLPTANCVVHSITLMQRMTAALLAGGGGVLALQRYLDPTGKPIFASSIYRLTSSPLTACRTCADGGAGDHGTTTRAGDSMPGQFLKVTDTVSTCTL